MQQDMAYLMEECIPEIILTLKLLSKLNTRNSIDVSCTSFYGSGGKRFSENQLNSGVAE